MQQRQPRLGDILDDYCPKERRLTNHVVVAMIGDAIKQTRCTTCQADHEYKHAEAPRPRRKTEQSALYSQVLAAVTPKKVTPPPAATVEHVAPPVPQQTFVAPPRVSASVGSGVAAFDALFDLPDEPDADGNHDEAHEEAPAHRRLIRAQLPRHEGQVATTRQAPDFTIRQPNPGRPKRFGGRPPRPGAGAQAQQGGNRQGNGGGNGNSRGNGRPQGGGSRQGQGNRQGGGRNRSR